MFFESTFGQTATIIVLSLATAAFSAAPSFAQNQTFALPQGCEAFVTIQLTDCKVSHHFTCESDPDGNKRRVELDENGMVYSGMIDSETQWVSSFHAIGGYNEQLLPDPQEPASFTSLIETGRDDYDFKTFSERDGVVRYEGRDILTGKTETIDGVTLEQTDYQITAYNEAGEVMWQSAGNEFISRDWRMFLSGTSTFTSGGEVFETNDKPVEFAFPNEPGFLSRFPKYGCNAVVSFALPLAPQDIPHG